MSLPTVAIVGRPNVGKSSLLNCLTKRMVSIVEPTAGVTRDRVTAIYEIDDAYFELVDTGGYGIEDHDNLTEHVERQIRYAIDEAALILFVVDVQAGVLPLDQRVAELLRRHHDRVMLVANKADDASKDPLVAEFNRLGYGEPFAVSAIHNLGRRDLLDKIVERVRVEGEQAPPEPIMKLAVVGKQNTGKSTFINALAGEEHVIVSEVPGTTRDAIDLRFEQDGRTFIAIDTAGVRKRAKMATSIEFYGFTRVQRSLGRADVVALFIDSTKNISSVDKKLARSIADEMKPCVLVINKWDLAKGKADAETYGDYLTTTIPELDYAPIVFTSAKDAHNVDAVVDTAWSLFKQSRTRVSTGQLNQVLEEALAGRGPSPKRGSKPPRIYYATQVAVEPPTIVLFVNNPAYVKKDYQRYLTNRMQAYLPFQEVPIRLVFRARRSGDRNAMDHGRPAR